MVIILRIFLDNDINGSLLMSDGLDDATVKEFIPKLKHRILFNSERMKLRWIFAHLQNSCRYILIKELFFRSKQQQKSTVSTVDTNDIDVTSKSIRLSDMVKHGS